MRSLSRPRITQMQYMQIRMVREIFPLRGQSLRCLLEYNKVGSGLVGDSAGESVAMRAMLPVLLDGQEGHSGENEKRPSSDGDSGLRLPGHDSAPASVCPQGPARSLPGCPHSSRGFPETEYDYEEECGVSPRICLSSQDCEPRHDSKENHRKSDWVSSEGGENPCWG